MKQPKLTKREWEELLMVAGNGYGDGDYYGLNGYDGFGEKKNAKYFQRAYKKIADALNLKHNIA